MARESVEPPQLRKANDKRRPSLSASRSCAQRSAAQNGHTPVLPSCPTRLRCALMMHRSPSSNGTPLKGLFLKRLGPCEGKLSSTVLRGGVSGNHSRLPAAATRRHRRCLSGIVPAVQEQR